MIPGSARIRPHRPGIGSSLIIEGDRRNGRINGLRPSKACVIRGEQPFCGTGKNMVGIRWIDGNGTNGLIGKSCLDCPSSAAVGGNLHALERAGALVVS